MKTKGPLIVVLFSLFLFTCKGQGRINNYFFGYGGWPRAYMDFPNNLPSLHTDSNIAIGFSYTHANISDTTGNLLFYTNGVSVIDANHDSMPNGTGINPCQYTTQAAYYGLSISQADLILPDPGNSNNYYLIHQSVDHLGDLYNSTLYYSKIDMTLNNGMGDVMLKNIGLFNDTLWAGGTTACKHANGRDWWIVVLRAHFPDYIVFLLTPSGITFNSIQTIGARWDFGQTAFSPDGKHYAIREFARNFQIFDFDRCSGLFSNPRIIPTNDSLWGSGICFAPNSKIVYATSALYVYQINLDSINLLSSLDTVAIWDSTYNPSAPIATTFEFMQIGPDGKIYMTTVWATPNMHVIEFPDSAGVACNVQQHIINLPTTNGNTIPNFVNYFLGPVVGSVCDSLGLGVSEYALHDFKFSIQPNPVINKTLSCKYVLPQNKAGVLEVYDMIGRKLFKEILPPWSTEQHFKLNLSAGVYLAKIICNKQSVMEKFVVE